MKIRRRRHARSAITLHDVAASAGVSPMTVSRVIGGQRNVSDAKRAKVNAAIEQLGYTPNPSARALASAGTLKIGLLYGNPSATFTSEFLVDLLESSSRSGCQLLLEKCSTVAKAKGCIGRLIDKGIDAVLLPTPFCDSLALTRQFDESEVPAVAVGTGREDTPGLSLRIDNFRAAEEMTQHLLALGHRDIGFIRGHPRQIDSAQRYEGFVAALRAAGIRLRPKRIKQGMYTYRSGLLAAEQLLKEADRPTAIFASNDDMAAGALATAHRLKLEVPGDLSIVGFDDTVLATTVWPQLTTIRQPVRQLTALALNMAMDEIRRRRAGEAPTLRRQELVKLDLVKRESASAPR